MLKRFWYVMLAALLLLLSANFVQAQSQQWKLVNPSGAVERIRIEPAPRINTLANKTIVLRWNGKHNGNVVLDRLAERLAKEVPSAKIIKSYETEPSLNSVSGSQARSEARANLIADMKADLLIASQAD